MSHTVDIDGKSADMKRRSGLFGQRQGLLTIFLAALFLMAGLVRLYRLDAPGVLVEREFVSAIFARHFYYEQVSPVAGWQQEVAAITKERQPVLEPPVTEYLVSLLYRATGGERLWVAHLLTSFFWLAGGLFFFKLGRMLLSTGAAFIATGCYLLSPLSILVGRSFQPDSLMMLLFLISLYGLVRHHRQPGAKGALLVGAITGLALLYRPLVLFTLLGAYLALAVYHRSWRGLFAPHTLLFGAASLLLPLAYYGYGLVIAGFLRWKVDTSFLPELYLRRDYWEGWMALAADQIGLVILIGALLGVPTLRRGMPRALLVGLGVGYLAFGLVFTAHIYTHGYYHAQLLPIAALPFGSLAAGYLDNLRRRELAALWWLPVLAVALIVLYFNFQTVRERLGAQQYESEALAREIGELVDHSTRTVFVARHYGMPLQYYGHFSGLSWPKADEPVLYGKAPARDQTIAERRAQLGYEPDYFIITDYAQLSRYHADLKEYLEENCLLRFESDQYLIYDGRCAESEQ